MPFFFGEGEGLPSQRHGVEVIKGNVFRDALKIPPQKAVDRLIKNYICNLIILF